ncbi:hypothetical protein J3F83DRAFT_722929 [Trichoderma novae-zelandiae]
MSTLCSLFLFCLVAPSFAFFLFNLCPRKVFVFSSVTLCGICLHVRDGFLEFWVVSLHLRRDGIPHVFLFPLSFVASEENESCLEDTTLVYTACVFFWVSLSGTRTYDDDIKSAVKVRSHQACKSVPHQRVKKKRGEAKGAKRRARNTTRTNTKPGPGNNRSLHITCLACRHVSM